MFSGGFGTVLRRWGLNAHFYGCRVHVGSQPIMIIRHFAQRNFCMCREQKDIKTLNSARAITQQLEHVSEIRHAKSHMFSRMGWGSEHEEFNRQLVGTPALNCLRSHAVKTRKIFMLDSILIHNILEGDH